MDNLELAYSMFNQFLFQEAKNNIEYLEHYFQTNPNTMSNPLISEFVYAVKTYSLDSIDLPLFQSIMTKHGKSSAESQKIIGEITKWKTYNRDQIAPARKFLQDICASNIISRANRLYGNSPSEFMKYLKNINFKTSNKDILRSVGFDEVDINSIIADSANDGIPSCYSWINDAFAPDFRIEKGNMILVSMSPGSGKSLYAMSEALFMASQGHRVHYLAMGDLNTKDFIVRMGAMFSGLSFANTKQNLGPIYKGLSGTLGDRLGITIVPAGEVSVEEYIEFIKDQDYDVLIVDYDSNFKLPGGDSMYFEYGEIYGKLTELTALGKIMFVLAQPKVSAWGSEVIELHEVGESSRKQHTVDMIITRGRVVGNPNNLGCFKMVKNRRGEVGIVDYSIRLDNGRFKSLPREVYEMLKLEKEKRNYTEADIDGKIRAYEITANKVKQKLDISSNFQTQPTNPIPKFDKHVGSPF